MFCPKCGKELSGNPTFCPNCSARLVEEADVSPKSRLATSLLAFFLGGLGIHRFYLGKISTGILMILTLGGLGIWTLIDFIFAVAGAMKDKEGRPIKNW